MNMVRSSNVGQLVRGGYSVNHIQNNFRLICDRPYEAAYPQISETEVSQRNDSDFISISNLLPAPIDETDEERRETPPPSYDDASCLPTYNEARVLFPSNSKFSIIENPLSSDEDMQSLYVLLPKNAERNTISSANNRAVANEAVHDIEAQTPDSSQQINSSFTGALNSIISYFASNDNPTSQLGEQAISNNANDHSNTHVINNPVQHITEHSETSSANYISQYVNQLYTRMADSRNQISVNTIMPRRQIGVSPTSIQNRSEHVNVVEDGVTDNNPAAEEDKEDIYGFHDDWCTFFIKQCKLLPTFLVYFYSGVVIFGGILIILSRWLF